MAITQILAPTLILNEQSISASATMSTIPAGTNRLVLVLFFTYAGSGNSNPPTAITCNGVAGTYIVGDSTANRTTVAAYYYNESQIASISGQTLTSTTGTAGSQKSIIVMAVDNAAQTNPINKGFQHVENPTAVSFSLVRTAGSYTVGFAATSVSGTQLTFSNPSTTSSIALTSTRKLTYGLATDTARTASFTCNSANSVSALAFNIDPFPTGTITDLNSGGNVKAGSTGNSVTSSGFSPTGGTGGGKTLTAWAGSNPYTFTQPAYVDGATYPQPDTSQTFIFTDGSQSPQITRVLESPINMTSVVATSPIIDEESYLGYAMMLQGKTPVTNDKFVYPTEGGNFTISSNGKITCLGAGMRVLWHWSVSDSVMTRMEVTINDLGEVIGVMLGITGRISNILTRSITGSITTIH